MTVLVVGANGQLGVALQRRARRGGQPCLALGRDALDITDREAVLDAVHQAAPSVVVNAAAYTAVDRAEEEPEAAYAVNRDGPGHLAEACGRADIPLIHVSTDYVYDGTKTGAWVEADPVAPLGVYGASKLAGEERVREALPAHVILRTAWVYGVDGHNFVKTMLRLGAERDALKVVDDQHGSPTFADDLADAIFTLSNRLAKGRFPDNGYGTFHCAGEGAVTWCGFARKIFELSAPWPGRRPEVTAITTAEWPTPAKRPANSVLDCGRLAATHDIHLRPWADALAEMLEEVAPEYTQPRSDVSERKGE